MKSVTLNDNNGWKWRLKYTEINKCFTLTQYNKKENIIREVSIWDDEVPFLEVFIGFVKEVEALRRKTE